MAREGLVALEPVGLGRDVDQIAEAGVGDRAVVALEVVLDGHLPVGLERVGRVGMEDERIDVDAAGADQLGELAEGVGERTGLGVGVDEDEGPPGLDARASQAELGAVERRVAVGARRRPQLAVEPVGPGVVVALERAAAAGPRHHLRAAVAADVHERAQLALAVADDDQRHVTRAQREVGAGLGELPEVAGVLPGAGEQPLALAREHLAVDVPAVGQGVRARQPRASRARSRGQLAPATGWRSPSA